MFRAFLVMSCASLAGCGALPQGSEGGFWFRIGPDANRSFAYHWTGSPRDPQWRCPKGESRASGIPTWMDCDPAGRTPLAPIPLREVADGVQSPSEQRSDITVTRFAAGFRAEQDGEDYPTVP